MFRWIYRNFEPTAYTFAALLALSLFAVVILAR